MDALVEDLGTLPPPATMPPVEHCGSRPRGFLGEAGGKGSRSRLSPPAAAPGAGGVTKASPCCCAPAPLVTIEPCRPGPLPTARPSRPQPYCAVAHAHAPAGRALLRTDRLLPGELHSRCLLRGQERRRADRHTCARADSRQQGGESRWGNRCAQPPPACPCGAADPPPHPTQAHSSPACALQGPELRRSRCN